MKLKSFCSAFACIFFINLAIPAHAGSRDGKIGLTAIFGSSALNFQDINNNYLQDTGYSIPTGYQWGGEISYGFSKNIVGFLGADYMTASTAYTQVFIDNLGDTLTYNGTLSLPVMSLGFGGYYVVPDLGENLDVKVGFRASYDFLNSASDSGTFTFADSNGNALEPPTPSTLNFSGDTFGIEFLAGFDCFLLPCLSVGMDVGYRLSKIGTVTFEDPDSGQTATLQDTNGNNIGVDLSGALMRFNTSLYF